MALGRIGVALLSPQQTIERLKPFTSRFGIDVVLVIGVASGTDGAPHEAHSIPTSHQ